MHRANDVRRGLQAVVDFAAVYNCAVVGITHFAKGSAGTSPQERVIGSQAFGAFARTVLVAAKQEDDEGRVLARAKSNISIDDGGVTYSIEPYTLDSGIQTTRVVWGEKVEGSARDILGAVEAPQTEETSEEEDAARFLRDLLADGPVPVKQVKADVFGAGYAWRTIERAKKVVGVDAVKLGMKEGWVWKLAPEDRQENTKTATLFSGGLRENLAVFGGNPSTEAEVGHPTKEEEF